MDNHDETLVTFRLSGQRFALKAAVVEEVVPSVLVGALPHAPGVVAGAVVVRGRLLPVFDVREALGLRKRPTELSDHFFVVVTARRRVVLVTEGASDVVRVSQDKLVTARSLTEKAPLGAHLAQLEDGTCAILEIDAFLSAAEHGELDLALEAASS